MNENIRIRVSSGLLIAAVVHALLLAVVFSGLHSQTNSRHPANDWQLPQCNVPGCDSEVGQIEQLTRPQGVNMAAQGELKQGAVKQQGNCINCPTVTHPTVVHPTVTYPAVTYTAAKPAVKKRYQIALFIDSSAESQRLLNWFNRDPKLLKLKSQTDFQVYTPRNSIYLARFAEIVPVSQFPVVLFQNESGGHIHAAGKSMIPRTADELHSDMRKSYSLYVESRKASRGTGALKSRGYSWDDQITPTMRLQSQDCPDGNCPVDGSDTAWRPGQRVRDGLFDDLPDGRNAFLWANSSELMTLGVIGVLVMLIGSVLLRKQGT